MSTLPPAQRPQESLLIQARRISDWAQYREMLDAMPDILLAVNGNREIVYANQKAAEFFLVSRPEELWGMRPGEAAGCINSHKTPEGCGTAEACRICGAFQAMQQGLRGETSQAECRMTLTGGGALDLSVWARPFDLEGERFLFLSIQDISDSKRREVLEKIFFHDILNTAGGLQSISEIIQGSAPSELRELRDVISSLSEQLVDEIQSQRDLLAAERGELHVQKSKVGSRAIVGRVICLYLRNQVCDGRSIIPADVCDDVTFSTDITLLVRVLGNLVKNALEATPVGEVVTIGCQSLSGTRLEFFVHNAKVIPEDVRLQIFNRSFSTKAPGRGLGTYSAKLLTERFLEGKMDFSSTEREGTFFFVQLPLQPGGDGSRREDSMPDEWRTPRRIGAQAGEPIASGTK